MTVVSENVVEAEIEDLSTRKPWSTVAREFLRKHPLGAAGLAVVLIMMFVSLFAEASPPSIPRSTTSRQC